MKLSKNAGHILRLVANILEHAEQTKGKVDLQILPIGVRIPGFDRPLTTGGYVLKMAYQPGHEQDSGGLHSLEGCLGEAELNPDGLLPYPDAEDVLEALKLACSYNADSEKLVRELFEKKNVPVEEVTDAKEEVVEGVTKTPPKGFKLVGVDD